MYSISGLPNIIKRQNFLNKSKPGIYYHYTSLSTLWAVLDGECLRATQACFSNDSEEVAKGRHLIAEIYHNKNNTSDKSLTNHSKVLFDETEKNIDCYIVCFCGEDDKLSQWRAYCRNDGVSIGFAFDGTEPYYYFADQPHNIQSGHSVELSSVWYLDENSTIPTRSGKPIVTKEALKDDIIKRLQEIEEMSDEHHEEDFLLSAIPLIKHAGFYEEDEHRLLIRNTQLEHGGDTEFPLDCYVQYRPDGDIKIPYLNIRFGRNYPEESTKTAKSTSHSADPLESVQYVELYDVDKKIATAIQTAISPIKVIVHSGNGCPQIVVGPAQESTQKEIFNKIDNIANGDSKDFNNCTVKIWCQGHLPIRSIRVSPCENQDQVIRSIKHYCLHKKYWLKYVDVYGSSIPYRRPR